MPILHSMHCTRPRPAQDEHATLVARSSSGRSCLCRSRLHPLLTLHFQHAVHLLSRPCLRGRTPSCMLHIIATGRDLLKGCQPPCARLADVAATGCAAASCILFRLVFAAWLAPPWQVLDLRVQRTTKCCTDSIAAGRGLLTESKPRCYLLAEVTTAAACAGASCILFGLAFAAWLAPPVQTCLDHHHPMDAVTNPLCTVGITESCSRRASQSGSARLKRAQLLHVLQPPASLLVSHLQPELLLLCRPCLYGCCMLHGMYCSRQRHGCS